MVKTGGENVAAIEVERCLIEHPAVFEAGVFGLPHERWGEELVAAVALSSGHSVTPEDLRNFVRERLSGFKVPKRVYFVQTLPKSSSGKIQKYVLRKRFATSMGAA
jgi:acyl-CoA synthetase (AMP-forming)/AMP-acid ligase II